MKRFCHGALKRPPFKTPAERCSVDAESFAPFGYTQGLAVVGQETIGRSVAILSLHCCPTTVTWFVATVVVNSVDGHAIWAWPHVCQKRLERVPSFTYGYSSTSVSPIFQVFASHAHGHPRSVLSGVCCAMCSCASGSLFSVQAPAAPYAPLHKVVNSDNCTRTTRAQTYPRSVPLRGSSVRDRRQSTECGPGQVESIDWKIFRYSSFSHAVFSFKEPVSVRGWLPESTAINPASYYPTQTDEAWQ